MKDEEKFVWNILVPLILIVGAFFLVYYVVTNMMELYSSWSTSVKKDKARFNMIQNPGLYTCGEGMFCDDNEVYETQDQMKKSNNDQIKYMMQWKQKNYAEDIIKKMKDVTEFRLKNKIDPQIQTIPTKVISDSDGATGIELDPTSDMDVFRKEADDEYSYDSNKKDTSYFDYLFGEAQVRLKKPEKDVSIEKLTNELTKIRRDLDQAVLARKASP